MATRRSRIKAVANLPARRNRPVASSNTNNETSEDTDADKTTSPSKNLKLECSIKNTPPDIKEKAESPSEQSETVADSLSTPDRKSVIVTVEKDRKSVIVNRDNCISPTQASSSDAVTELCNESPLTSERLDTEINHTLRTNSEPESSKIRQLSQCSKTVPSSEEKEDSIVPKSDIEANVTANHSDKGGKTVSVDPTPAASNDAAVSQNSRLPMRSRRTKPTVNLTAAARKRPASELSVSSPCSPPPNKLKPSELLQRKISESNDVIPTPKPDEKNKLSAPSDLKESTKVSDIQTSASSSNSPEESLRDKAVNDSSGLFKVPESSPVKTKDHSLDTSSESPSTLEKTNTNSLKETSSGKRKQSSNAQKLAAARKSLKTRLTSDGPLPRSSLTMFDLIFYNPTKNPMKSTDTPSQKPRDRLNSVSSVSSIHEDRLNEESIDDVDGDGGKENTNDDPEETAMPVPQVKVGPDGSLILDEQSLVIETTGTKRSLEELERSEVVIETGSSYGHYKKIIRSKDWSDHETKKFYRALNVVGTDFSLMKPYFRKRTRRELKLKFKKEEKINPKLINKALAEPLDFDISELEKECELEDEEEKRLEELAKRKEAEKEAEVDEPSNPEETVKKPVKKKRRSKCLAAMAEILTGEEEDSPSTSQPSQPKKPAPKARPKKVKRDGDADIDYGTLALGIDSVDRSQGKKQSSGGVVVPKGTPKQTSKVKKEILPLSASQNVNTEPSPSGLFNLAGETPHKTIQPTKKIVGDQDTNPQEGATSGTVKVVKSYKKKPVKSIQNPSSSSSEIPTNISGVSYIAQPATISNSQSPLDPGLCTPTTSRTIPISHTKVVAAPPQLNTPVQSTPQRFVPLIGVGMTPPNAIQVVRRPIVQTTPISASDMRPVTSPITSSTILQPSAIRTVQVSGSLLPSTSTCIVSSSGSKMYQSSPISRLRTVPVTPQNVQNQASFGVTTPVSRLLPSTPPLPRMEPGSIIVLKTPLPQDPDRHILQVYMVTNTPQGSSPHNAIPISPNLPGINLLTGPTVQPASSKSPCVSDDSDAEKVLTKL